MKIKYLLLPILGALTLFSCNDGGRENLYQVSETEFNDALSFKNIQYLQVQSQSVLSSPYGSDTVTTLIESSPKVCHVIMDTLSSLPSYLEKFVIKNNDNTYDEYLRNAKTGIYSFTKDVEESEFVTLTPQSMNMLIVLKSSGISYKDFKYNLDDKVYEATFIPVGTYETLTRYKFENKRIIKADLKSIEEDLNTTITTYAYDEKTPLLPNC
ncbi:MAG: hypothetical protein MJ208_02545 [Bacilli bacterium]|nr:hypothetical protein [Bacilli bacterium]